MYRCMRQRWKWGTCIYRLLTSKMSCSTYKIAKITLSYFKYHILEKTRKAMKVGQMKVGQKS